MQHLEEAQDKEFFNILLDRFEKVWVNCFQGRSISKSAAFTGFINVDRTQALLNYFSEADLIDDIDEGDEWKTKQ